jgi:hypothetical protein
MKDHDGQKPTWSKPRLLFSTTTMSDAYGNVAGGSLKLKGGGSSKK